MPWLQNSIQHTKPPQLVNMNKLVKEHLGFQLFHMMATLNLAKLEIYAAWLKYFTRLKQNNPITFHNTLWQTYNFCIDF